LCLYEIKGFLKRKNHLIKIITLITHGIRKLLLVNIAKAVERMERAEKIKKEFSASYFVECAICYRTEEWNTKFDAYLKNEWQCVFDSRPFDPDRLGELFAKNNGAVNLDFHNIDFRKYNCGNIDISLFHLDGVNFSDAKFETLRASSARLQGADFSRAAISSASFSNSDFSECNFDSAEMPNAVLERVNLKNSSFNNANLNNAKLTNCDICGTEFFETYIQDADFSLSIVDGRTLLTRVKVNTKTNFAGVGLALCRIYPPALRRDIENNILPLDKTNKDVFVAMPFNYQLLDSALDNAIQPACQELGLHALPVKDKAYTGSITNKIKKSIAQSRLVIAELTYRNLGVYYEAGYAEGRNVPVIYTCNMDWCEKEGVMFAEEKRKKMKYPEPVHFDVKQTKILFWNTEEELKKLLVTEIKGVLGLPS